MPAHQVYVEPFGGAGSVLMRKPRAAAEVYNDIWGVVVDVFRCLRDPATAAELDRRLRLTPFARTEFFAATLNDDDDLVERARKTIIRSFMGFGSASTNGDYLTGFRASSSRSGTIPPHDWANYPDCIPHFVARLLGVVIENRPAIEVIKHHDTSETLHYVDPPYPHVTRNMKRGNAAYAHEMHDADHEQLAEVLHGVQGMVMLSTYGNELYDRLYPDWHRMAVHAQADGARKRVEVLLLNPACANAQSQRELIA